MKECESEKERESEIVRESESENESEIGKIGNIGKRKKTLKNVLGSQLLPDVQTFLAGNQLYDWLTHRKGC